MTARASRLVSSLTMTCTRGCCVRCRAWVSVLFSLSRVSESVPMTSSLPRPSDKTFVSPRQIDRDANPGIVVIPRGDAGRLDWSLISAVLANVVLYRELYDQTVLQLYPSGRFTLWNPNEHTDRMEPIFGRVSEERELQAWVDDDYEPAPNPEY